MIRHACGFCGLAVLVLGGLGMVGCTQSHTVADWQRAADRYVAEEHHYDLAAMADAQSRSMHRVFKTLAHDEPEQAGDVVGVLVGPHVQGDRPWMVFIVGEVDQRELQNSRLIAVSQDGQQLLWAVGPESERATATYRRHQLMRHDGRTPYKGWPEEGDAYRLRQTETGVAVTELRSGSVWLLNFEETPITATPTSNAPARTITPTY